MARDWSGWIARAMRMSPQVWERHANPWSAWTRVPIAPALCLAVWARDWVGPWCLLAVAALIVWTWWNPRAFPPPAQTQSWASRAVLGERVWLSRHERAIPRHHALWAGLLSGVAALGLPLIVWGLAALQIWPLLLGLAISMGAKMWFLDRMVWLWEDMRHHAPYASWHRPGATRGGVTSAPSAPI